LCIYRCASGANAPQCSSIFRTFCGGDCIKSAARLPSQLNNFPPEHLSLCDTNRVRLHRFCGYTSTIFPLSVPLSSLTVVSSVWCRGVCLSLRLLVTGLNCALQQPTVTLLGIAVPSTALTQYAVQCLRIMVLVSRFLHFLCRCQMCWSEPKCGGTTFNTDACSAMGWSFCASAVNAKRSGYAADVCRSCADARDVLTFLPTPQCSSQLTSFLITTCSMNATAVTMPPGVCAKVLAELNSYSGYLLADPRSFLSAVAFSDLQALVKYWW
jgi:hypothetical protein